MADLTLPRTVKRRVENFPLLRHIVGIARELLTLPEPAEWFPPEIIGDRTGADGYRVLTVRASNSRDLDQFTGGVTGRQVVCTRIDNNLWEIHTEDLL